MKKILLILLLLVATTYITIYACHKKNKSKAKKINTTSTLLKMTNNNITLTELYSPEFNDAQLALEQKSTYEQLDSNILNFKYDIKNYNLGVNTTNIDKTFKTCANSAQGQHIHNIIDNEPYTAHYTNEFQKKINPGYHIILSFLSRSYHESIKNKNAYTLTTAITGKGRETKRYMTVNLDLPHLFYSRPKGEYKGTEADAILLDFYLVNCNLSKDGYKVKVEINKIPFTITKWCAFFMEGLPNGENTVKLTLLDKDNNAVESPYNPSIRTFKIVR